MDESTLGLVQLVLLIVAIAGLWKTFAKAGQPGWGAIIPIYNLYLLTVIAKRPWWWLLLFFIPLVNFIIFIILSIDVAKKFGQNALFGIGLFFLGFIFYPVLGFGKYSYRG